MVITNLVKKNSRLVVIEIHCTTKKCFSQLKLRVVCFSIIKIVCKFKHNNVKCAWSIKSTIQYKIYLTCCVEECQFIGFSIAHNCIHKVVEDSWNVFPRKRVWNLGKKEASFAHSTITYYNNFKCFSGRDCSHCLKVDKITDYWKITFLKERSLICTLSTYVESVTQRLKII